MLAETGGRRLILSEVAARAGLSQSYAHRFFRTKADLVRGLAERWFAEVEAAADAAAAAPGLSAEARLEAWALAILRVKRDRHDADPALFRAYLDLARDHMDVAASHAARLCDGLSAILREMGRGPDLAAAEGAAAGPAGGRGAAPGTEPGAEPEPGARRGPDGDMAMVLDALHLFHSPFAIALHRDRVSDDRARAVIGALIRALRAG